MRIIGGTAGGRHIKIPKSLPIVPSAGKVKMALFEILKHELAGASVLDLYGGSGNLALEALSRGAAKAVLSDNEPDCVNVIKENAVLLGFAAQAECLALEAERAVEELKRNGEKFDIIIIDPPYLAGQISLILKCLETNDILKSEGVIAIKRDGKEAVPEGTAFIMEKEKKYGGTFLTFLRKAKK